MFNADNIWNIILGAILSLIAGFAKFLSQTAREHFTLYSLIASLSGSMAGGLIAGFILIGVGALMPITIAVCGFFGWLGDKGIKKLEVPIKNLLAVFGIKFEEEAAAADKKDA